MTKPRTLDDVTTPAGVVDVVRMQANLDRMASYVRDKDLALRPHIKTHKIPKLAQEQLARGAVGITAATLHEAHVMSRVADDILIAYPPVGAQRLERIMQLPDHVRVTVGLDSHEALAGVSAAAKNAGRTIGVYIEMDVGMHRVGLPDVRDIVDLAGKACTSPAIAYRGVMFYPGHIRQNVEKQADFIAELNEVLAERIDALNDAGLRPEVVSGGSTPAAFASHDIDEMTEIRPGTYIFNDRTTAEIGACSPDDCAYTVLATVVSTAVSGQAVTDAGSKALGREPLRGAEGEGFGALLDHPEVTVRAMSEEHGTLDLSKTSWRPRIGDRVRIVPNHVCYSVNLQPLLWAVHEGRVVDCWDVAARGWGGTST
jgi:D-serine deaminase-like pyridoxal phosphate-dependent protein